MATYLSILDYLSRQEPRNYRVLLDCGPAMQGAAWDQAELALLTLLPYVCGADAAGMSLTVFADSYMSVEHLSDEAAALQAVDDMRPVLAGGAASRLSAALRTVLPGQDLQARELESSGMASVLVITTGLIDDLHDVRHTIAEAVQRMTSYFELGVSFIQVGDDPFGAELLGALAAATRSRCRWPVVDWLSLSSLPEGAEGLKAYLRRSSSPVGWVAGAAPGGRRAASWGPSPFPDLPAFEAEIEAEWDTDGDGKASPRIERAQQVALSFFNSLAKRDTKEYGVLLDCSQGMGLTDYNVARHILSRTLASVYDLNEDGITVWVTKGAKTIGTEYITSGQMLDKVFWEHTPEGATRLSSGLHHTLSDYFCNPAKQGRRLAVLVVVASPPVDWYLVTDMLVKAAVEDAPHRRLTISFLNVGSGLDFTEDLADEVNTRAARAFVDAYQIPTGRPDTHSGLARRVSVVLQEEDDLVGGYVDAYFPESVIGANFDILSSKQFYRHVQEQNRTSA